MSGRCEHCYVGRVAVIDIYQYHVWPRCHVQRDVVDRAAAPADLDPVVVAQPRMDALNDDGVVVDDADYDRVVQRWLLRTFDCRSSRGEVIVAGTAPRSRPDADRSRTPQVDGHWAI